MNEGSIAMIVSRNVKTVQVGHSRVTGFSHGTKLKNNYFVRFLAAVLKCLSVYLWLLILGR